MGEEEVWGLGEKAHRVLQAAAVEARGRAGAYVIGERVMGRPSPLLPNNYQSPYYYSSLRTSSSTSTLLRSTTPRTA